MEWNDCNLLNREQDRYASYRQLDELFKELKKKYARLSPKIKKQL